MMTRFRSRAAEILWSEDQEDVVALRIRRLIALLILVNVMLVVLESVEHVGQTYRVYFRYVEAFSVVAFTLEYVMRLWSSRDVGAFKNSRTRFVFSPLGIVDFLAVFPFYVPFMIPLDLRFIRCLRLIALFRVLKLARYSDALRLLSKVFRKSREELGIVLFVLSILLVFTGGLMHLAEHDAQPEKFSSIPASMWYGIITFTTIGYGDIVPITVMGKLIGTAMALIGIGVFALPTGIISIAFMEELKKEPAGGPMGICPYCEKFVETLIRPP